MTLLPCRSCGRHVRSQDSQCPFCGAARSCDEKPPTVLPAGRRLKAMALTAALGASACSSGSAQPLYGVVSVPDDAGSDAPSDATPDSPMGQTLYGVVAPPVDAGDGGSETG